MASLAQTIDKTCNDEQKIQKSFQGALQNIDVLVSNMCVWTSKVTVIWLIDIEYNCTDDVSALHSPQVLKCTFLLAPIMPSHSKV